MLAEEVKFCPRCGTSLVMAEKLGRLRPVCPRCTWIYFADPKVAAAVRIERDGQVLLVRRTNEPQRGLWTVPAGFIDAGEDPAQAAERECLEETGLRVRVTGLLDVIYGLEHPHGAHIVIAYIGEVLSGELHPGDDADRAAFFPISELPPLAFQATRRILGLTSDY
jgi:ADP-ribose pyrophosphatase YjhB (NUDIX family)